MRRVTATVTAAVVPALDDSFGHPWGWEWSIYRRVPVGNRKSRPQTDGSPVLTAPVSAGPALFATVRARPGPFRRTVKTASSSGHLGQR